MKIAALLLLVSTFILFYLQNSTIILQKLFKLSKSNDIINIRQDKNIVRGITMNNSILKNHIYKVNKIMSFFLIFLAVISVIYCFVVNMPILLLSSAIFIFISIFILFAYRKQKFETLSSYILCISLILTFVLPFPNKEYLFVSVIPIIVAAMYFNQKLFIISTFILNISIIAKELAMGKLDTNFLITLIVIDFIILVLFFLSKMGNNLIILASSENDKVSDLLSQLKETIEIVKTNSDNLNKDITHSNFNLESIKKNGETVTSSVQEISKGIIEQTESVSKISEMMNEADQKVEEVNELSKQLADISSETSDIVVEGSEKITNMDKQMNIINQAVTKSYSTVLELNENMDEVNSFLSGIAQISEQTNLLALNAAIEAARAGESGKGFAVVAEEVRKLAEQSTTTADQISQIITTIKEKSKDVLEEVQNGTTATNEGEKIVKQVNENFNKINLSFKEIDKYISEELTKNENISLLFSQIRSETESIASISEEHSAATEELMATTEEHNASIETIYNSMLEIQKSCENLQEVVKN